MVPLVTHAAVAALALFGVVASWDATLTAAEDSLVDRLPGLPHQLRLDRENLVGGSVPGALAQRADFRKSWCGLADIPTEICGSVPAATPYETNRLILDRRAHCRSELGIDGAKLVERCDGYFLEIDRKFDAAWAEARREKLANLPRLDLSGRNLAGASAEDVNLTAARMEDVDLSGARLPWARLEGAALKAANLADASAFYADLAYADLTWATLDGANLESAKLQGAVLRGARLQGANLNHVNLVAADLTNADLRGASLRFAKLHRADLSGALIAGADLTEATGLTQAQLDRAIGDANTRLTAPRVVLPKPRVIVPSEQPLLSPFRVSTCWPDSPETCASCWPGRASPTATARSSRRSPSRSARRRRRRWSSARRRAEAATMPPRRWCRRLRHAVARAARATRAVMKSRVFSHMPGRAHASRRRLSFSPPLH